MNNIPVTIISGYLGAGKTTLVNHLLRNPAGKRLAILVNDFGDLPIDADLIEAQDDDLISLSGGCVCCSYGSGMVEAFLKLKSFDPMPDHVILEASGVAIPSAIVGSLSIMDGFNLDGVICLVDAPQIQHQFANRYLADTIEQQFSGSDILLLNKIDLIEKEEQDQLADWLESITSRTAILRTRFAAVVTELLLRPFDRPQEGDGNEHNHHNDNYHTDIIDPQNPVEPEAFVQEVLKEYPDLLRAKGFVLTPKGEMKTIQIVGKRSDISNAPASALPGVVVISLKKAKSKSK